VTTLLVVPPSLDDTSFESMVSALAEAPQDGKLLVDARHTRWASPYGLVGLLTLAQTRAEPPQFLPPESDETASYWARSGFFKYAEQLFAPQRALPRSRIGDSHVLLEVTPIATHDDVQKVVGHIAERAAAILTTTLGLASSVVGGFSMVLSECCQNIPEHAEAPGWVAVQRYNWQKRLGRQVAVVAVSDGGRGFRYTLEHGHQRPAGDRWDDAAALEAAVLRGVSRFRDPGRGQGLAGIRRYMGKWDARLSVRSGTARITTATTWDDSPPRVEGLAPFPGAQVQIIIPGAPET
jgi:anti-sigma regulatory factor (Ser/Thr protein kinase)